MLISDLHLTSASIFSKDVPGGQLDPEDFKETSVSGLKVQSVFTAYNHGLVEPSLRNVLGKGKSYPLEDIIKGKYRDLFVAASLNAELKSDENLTLGKAANKHDKFVTAKMQGLMVGKADMFMHNLRKAASHLLSDYNKHCSDPDNEIFETKKSLVECGLSDWWDLLNCPERYGEMKGLHMQPLQAYAKKLYEYQVNLLNEHSDTCSSCKDQLSDVPN